MKKNNSIALVSSKTNQKSLFAPLKKQPKGHSQKLSFDTGGMSLKRVIHHILWVLKGVQVYALVGKTGTGKSFRAQLVAQKYGIDMLIDDGLLIKDQKILAGRSAKREKTRLAAVKTSIFMDHEHAEKVIKVLERENFKRILLIGTSEKMVKKVAQRLNLTHPHKIISIEAVATEDEINEARKSRINDKNHIIPAPAVEVKFNYPFIFFKSVKVFFKKNFPFHKRQKMFEKSVVKPQYSEKGQIAISETVLGQMVSHCVKEFDSRLKIERIIVERGKYSYSLEIVLDIPFDVQISGTMHKLQSYVIESIERFAGLILDEVNVTVGKLEEPGN